ncbi:MAG: hypothetical protein GF383_08945 [Candidatus Lokiarchaeota archaeon]|nr:hypothetical protein [Candidatus Lokiarchaeota archaeon]MBD3340561.1 hypothetical protein [Candidatus Lokiarchaeota archaeon]
MRKTVKIRLCPKCRQPTLKSATNVSGWLAPSMFECTNEDCGYIGYLCIEVDPEDFERCVDKD